MEAQPHTPRTTRADVDSLLQTLRREGRLRRGSEGSAGRAGTSGSEERWRRTSAATGSGRGEVRGEGDPKWRVPSASPPHGSSGGTWRAGVHRNGSSPAPTVSSCGLSEDEYARLKQRNKEWKESIQKRTELHNAKHGREQQRRQSSNTSPTHTDPQTDSIEEAKGDTRQRSQGAFWKVLFFYFCTECRVHVVFNFVQLLEFTGHREQGWMCQSGLHDARV